jgi:hypothetical protein
MARLVLALAALVAALGARPAWAEEAKAPIDARMLLNLVAPVAESREAAFSGSLKDPGPVPASGNEPEVLADGSVRYGSGRGAVTVTLKNPCPPGTAHYEPPPLPGRRR